MGVEGLDLEPGRGLARVHDPHADVEEELVADPVFLDPLLGEARRGSEPVVEVDAVAEPLLSRLGHHLGRLADVVADGLLAQDVQARLQRFHGRLVVVAAVFLAARGDAHHVELRTGHHLGDRVERGHSEALRRRVGPLAVDVADGHEFGSRHGLVDVGMLVADRPEADHPHSGHLISDHGRSPGPRRFLRAPDERNGTYETYATYGRQGPVNAARPQHPGLAGGQSFFAPRCVWCSLRFFFSPACSLTAPAMEPMCMAS